MRTLLVLVLLAALGAGGYLSRPNIDAQRSHANKLITDLRASKDGKDSIGDLLSGLFETSTRKDDFQDYYVATKYTAKADDKVLTDCWGAFSQFFCSTPVVDAK